MIPFESTTYAQFIKKTKNVRWYYNEINKKMCNYRLNELYVKWSNDCVDFDFDRYAQAYVKLYAYSNQLNLRSFQFRLLHKALVLNDKLFRWKIKSNNYCTFCNVNVKENVRHFFWECEKVQKVYSWTKEICVKIYPEEQCHISYDSIILNDIKENANHIFNLIFLLAKHYVYVQRCKNEVLNKTQLQSKVFMYKRLEYYTALKAQKVMQHFAKWNIKNTDELLYTNV